MDSAVSHSTVYIILTEIYSIRSLGRNSIRILFYRSKCLTDRNNRSIQNRPSAAFPSCLSSICRPFSKRKGQDTGKRIARRLRVWFIVGFTTRGRGSDWTTFKYTCNLRIKRRDTGYFKSYRTLFSSVSMASLIYSQIFLEMKKINRHVRLLQQRLLRQRIDVFYVQYGE